MKNKINKADDPTELIRLALKEIAEWAKVRDNADVEIRKWKAFIRQLKKDEKSLVIKKYRCIIGTMYKLIYSKNNLAGHGLSRIHSARKAYTVWRGFIFLEV